MSIMCRLWNLRISTGLGRPGLEEKKRSELDSIVEDSYHRSAGERSAFSALTSSHRN